MRQRTFHALLGSLDFCLQVGGHGGISREELSGLLILVAVQRVTEGG